MDAAVSGAVDPAGAAPGPGGHVPPLACPACGEPTHDGARFCEACGTPLAPFPPAGPLPGPGAVRTDPDPEPMETFPSAPVAAGTAGAAGAPGSRPCVRCGGAVADDGYCTECGEPAASERDHWAEHPVAWVAGVCDRGVRHARNEDAMALAASGPFAALVVCDGVSSAPDSDVASLAAARAACDLLAAGGPTGAAPVVGETTARMGAWSALLGDAVRAADDAVRVSAGDVSDRANPPSCTFVAAVVDGPLVVTGWVGDSRAYWLPDAGGAHQLSVDDSWTQEMIAQGVPRAQAESSPQAHAITRWLGPDAPDPTARTAATLPDGPGWVLVCSDGLWNYCSPADDLAALVRTTEATTGREPGALGAALVRWANAQGGRDNITVALARFEPGPPTR
ncbi:PP2C family serine/threonine-protein phosphatase [Cellulosimicrobium sp. NPDC057127]|uniref:PP2C family serine/threonine-protein phosphatase n=1 Tax=Cellulosimicrobium sp. NPDC057127 TaxID=3346026 RepID=UPI00363A29F4